MADTCACARLSITFMQITSDFGGQPVYFCALDLNGENVVKAVGMLGLKIRPHSSQMLGGGRQPRREGARGKAEGFLPGSTLFTGPA